MVQQYTYVQHKQDPLPSQLVIFLIQDFLIQNLELPSVERISNSYTRICLPVCGDNPRALASGLSRIQADKHDSQ